METTEAVALPIEQSAVDDVSPFKVGDMPGVVTVVNWTMTPKGTTRLHFWCKHWVVVPDKQMPIRGFKSTEKWTLFAVVDGVVIQAIPGCQVKSWVRCESPPPNAEGSGCHVWGET